MGRLGSREQRTEIDEVAQAVPGAQDDARRAAIRALAAPIANGRAVSDCLGRVDTALVRDPQALRNFGLAAHTIGDPPAASALLAEAEARCRADGLLGLLPQVLCVQAAARLELGDWDRASALAAEAAEVAEHTAQWNWVAAATVVLARAYALQGNGDRAMALAGESEHLAGNRGLHDVHALGRIARGSAWLSAGQYVEAYDELSPLFHDDELRDIEHERMSAIMLFVEAAVHTQRDEDAAAPSPESKQPRVSPRRRCWASSCFSPGPCSPSTAMPRSVTATRSRRTWFGGPGYTPGSSSPTGAGYGGSVARSKAGRACAPRARPWS